MTTSISEVDKAYLAGFVDGEGCIQAVRGKLRKFKTGPGYRPQLTVAQLNPEPLLWAQELWGVGSVRKVSTKERSSIWQVIGTGVQPVLVDILPYLKVKRAEAIVALDLWERGMKGSPQEAFFNYRLLQILKMDRHIVESG